MKEIRNFGILFELSWMVAASVLIPLGIGVWLDHLLSTSPLFILIGALVGILTASVGVVRIVNRALDGAGESSKMMHTDEIEGKGD